MTVSVPAHRTGKVRSGDVELFYRAFGEKGATPVLILHGSNYFDSYDWIGVAAGLAVDREVVAFDHRGFGLSDWSPSKDYALDAHMDDIRNLTAHFGWRRPAIFGHSMSGRLSIFFAANFPDDLSSLIIVDSALGRGNPGAYTVSVGNPPLVFESVEAAMAHFADRPNPPRFALDRERAERALRKVDDGWMLLRDPDYRNTQSQTPGAPLPKLRDLDMWAELHRVACPTLMIRGRRSDRQKPEIVARVDAEYPEIETCWVDSQHDVARGAPDAVIAAAHGFLRRLEG